jgi:CRISPR/Cas system-associated exonuclease Cas4 (RecB family)
LTNEFELHPSSVGDYLECPKLYEYAYILELPTFGSEYAPHLVRGTSMHLATQLFYKLLVYKEIPKEYKDVYPYFERKALEALRKTWQKDGYESQDQEREFYIESVAMMKIFAYNQLQQWFLRIQENKGSRPDAFRNFIPKFDEEPLEQLEINVKGTVDAVYTDYNGDKYAIKTIYEVPVVKVVDYKTSRIRDFTVPEKYKIQTKIYAYLLYADKGILVHYVGILYFRLGMTFYFEVSLDDIIETGKFLEEIQANIKAKHFPKNRGDHCFRCPFYSICYEQITVKRYLEIVVERRNKREAEKENE